MSLIISLLMNNLIALFLLEIIDPLRRSDLEFFFYSDDLTLNILDEWY